MQKRAQIHKPDGYMCSACCKHLLAAFGVAKGVAQLHSGHKLILLLISILCAARSERGRTRTAHVSAKHALQAPESTSGQPCGSLSAGNIRQIFRGVFEMPCAEWYPSVNIKLN
eukprot:9487188-Pyramimonas_sp.AAC.1